MKLNVLAASILSIIICNSAFSQDKPPTHHLKYKPSKGVHNISFKTGHTFQKMSLKEFLSPKNNLGVKSENGRTCQSGYDEYTNYFVQDYSEYQQAGTVVMDSTLECNIDNTVLINKLLYVIIEAEKCVYTGQGQYCSYFEDSTAVDAGGNLNCADQGISAIVLSKDLSAGSYYTHTLLTVKTSPTTPEGMGTQETCDDSDTTTVS